MLAYYAGIDILHSFLFKDNGYAWSANLLAGVTHLVTSARNCKEIGFLGGWVNRLAFWASDVIICNGEAVRSFIVRHFNAPSQKSMVIYNGIDLDRFLTTPVPATCEGLDLKPEYRLVITVARLVPQKDVGLFIEAAKLLDHEYARVRFLVVGDGPCRSDLMRCASENGLDGKISFLGERDDILNSWQLRTSFGLPRNGKDFRMFCWKRWLVENLWSHEMSGRAANSSTIVRPAFWFPVEMRENLLITHSGYLPILGAQE